jgi:hypothetical protein
MLQEPPRTPGLIERHMFVILGPEPIQRVRPSYVERLYLQGQGQIEYSTGSQAHMLTAAPARQRPVQMGYPGGPQAQRKAQGLSWFLLQAEREAQWTLRRRIGRFVNAIKLDHMWQAVTCGDAVSELFGAAITQHHIPTQHRAGRLLYAPGTP